MPTGWWGESARHSLAARGIKTVKRTPQRYKVALDKIFVRRYKVGFRGTKKYDRLVNADNPIEAKRIYAFARGRKTTSEISIKR